MQIINNKNEFSINPTISQNNCPLNKHQFFLQIVGLLIPIKIDSMIKIISQIIIFSLDYRAFDS